MSDKKYEHLFTREEKIHHHEENKTKKNETSQNVSRSFLNYLQSTIGNQKVIQLLNAGAINPLTLKTVVILAIYKIIRKSI